MFNGSFTPNLKASTWQVWITNQFEDYHKGCAYGASLPNGKNGIAMQLWPAKSQDKNFNT